MPTKKLLGDIGCVEVILARMETHPHSMRIQLLGCLAIGKIVYRMKDNAERVQKSGGVALIIAAMKTHPNSEIVQRRGCRTLFFMSEWEEYRPLIEKEGGVSAIASVVEQYRDHPELHKLASKAMKNLFK